jgi:hypothetical protein
VSDPDAEGSGSCEPSGFFEPSAPSEPPGRSEVFELERRVGLSGLSYKQLWLLQVAVGGDASRLEVEAYVLGLLRMDAHEYDVLVQSLNEHLITSGQEPFMPRRDDAARGTSSPVDDRLSSRRHRGSDHESREGPGVDHDSTDSPGSEGPNDIG